MAGRAQPKDGTHSPVQVGIMMPQPRIPQDHTNMWRLQDVELYRLLMIAGQEHVDWSSLMSDGPQKMAIQGTDCNQTGKRHLTHPQL